MSARGTLGTKGTPRYLVIRRDNIGDLLCTTPLIAALREKHPGAYIAALVNSYNRDVLRGNPDLDEIFFYTKAKHRERGQSLLGVMLERLRMFRNLRKASIDIAILAAPGLQPRSLRLARMAGAKRVLGFVDQPGDRGIELGVPRQGGQGLHEVEDVFRLAAALGIDGVPPAMKVVADASLQRQVEAQLAARFQSRPGKLLAVHISARKPSQRWPVDNFIRLIRQLCESGGVRVMLLWSPGTSANALHPGDDEKAATIERALDPQSVLPLPTKNLGDLIAAISACDAMLCSDGGAMHIAAALGKPMVCMFGDSQAFRWHPWHTRHELIQPESRDVGDISVEQVTSALKRLT